MLLWFFVLAVVLVTQLCVDTHAVKHGTPKRKREFRHESILSNVCTIGEFALDKSESFSKSNCLSEMEPFLRVWNPQIHDIFVNKSTATGSVAEVNHGGNGFYHSFAIWMLMKKLKETSQIDSYVESGVWKGIVLTILPHMAVAR